MTATIVHRPAENDLPEVWEVTCCTKYCADDPWAWGFNGEGVGVAPGAEVWSTEANAIRSLVAHLADEHGVMVVRTLVVHDESPCPGVDALGCRTALGLPCVRCNDIGVLTSERTVTVDQHTHREDTQ